MLLRRRRPAFGAGVQPHAASRRGPPFDPGGDAAGRRLQLRHGGQRLQQRRARVQVKAPRRQQRHAGGDRQQRHGRVRVGEAARVQVADAARLRGRRHAKPRRLHRQAHRPAPHDPQLGVRVQRSVEIEIRIGSDRHRPDPHLRVAHADARRAALLDGAGVLPQREQAVDGGRRLVGGRGGAAPRAPPPGVARRPAPRHPRRRQIGEAMSRSGRSGRRARTADGRRRRMGGCHHQCSRGATRRAAETPLPGAESVRSLNTRRGERCPTPG